MKKIVFFVVILGFFVSGRSFAETVYLKDGTIIKGTITNRNADRIIIKGKGAPGRYFMQQIDRIEEDDSSSDDEFRSSGKIRKIEAIPEKKVELILKFIKLDGTRKRMEDNLNNVILKAPADKQDKIKSLINVDGIINDLIPIYDKIFTEYDLEEIVMFYESYSGQKFVKNMPILVNETLKRSMTYLQGKLEGIF